MQTKVIIGKKRKYVSVATVVHTQVEEMAGAQNQSMAAWLSVLVDREYQAFKAQAQESVTP